jgi:hypothetical protein
MQAQQCLSFTVCMQALIRQFQSDQTQLQDSLLDSSVTHKAALQQLHEALNAITNAMHSGIDTTAA